MKKAVVLLSGGQDSSTCLFWAIRKYHEITAIGFDYGQKHKQELHQAALIAEIAQVPYTVINVKGALSGSSLLDHAADHNKSHAQNANLPASFTPGRNMLFLTVAAGFAFNMGVSDIVTGVCQTDYSGYPDCRREFIDSLEDTLGLAMQKTFNIETPLMYMTKAETFKLAKDLGVLNIIIEHTLTDYNGDMTLNEWGRGVNNNPATALRVKGYEEAKQKGWV